MEDFYNKLAQAKRGGTDEVLIQAVDLPPVSCGGPLCSEF
jgi:hypothetical protein